MLYDPSACKLCPRRCGADRTSEHPTSVCGAKDKIRLSRAELHRWEEPFISGERGSGAIFFSGCSLKCVYCQNYTISHENKGKDIGEERFCEICFELKEKGAHNLNLVSADHYVPYIADALRKIKPSLGIPIIYNCSGYQSEEILEYLDGIIDVYLVDIKYLYEESAARYSFARDYPQVAIRALDIMLDKTGPAVFSADGMLQKGVVLRHLVLPGSSRESVELVKYLGERYSSSAFLFSLMSQYTPNGKRGAPVRPITALEYNRVCRAALECGFSGCFQERSSADKAFTPEFDMSGV